MVCTYWSVTHEHSVMDNFICGKPWGLENLFEAELYYKALMVGEDQFGGNNDAQPILDTYEMGIKEYRGGKMRARMEVSTVLLLKTIFEVGVFENPYVAPAETKKVIGQPAFMKARFET